MTDEELARRLTEALDARIARAASAPVSREVLNRLPEPETAEGTVVEAIPIRRIRWKTALAAVLAVFMLGAVGLLVFKLAGQNGPTQNPIPAQSGSTEETWTTEPTEAITLPEVSFDEETKTLRVVGTKDYDRLDLTPYLTDAKILEAEDDEFRFSADVALMDSMLKEMRFGVDFPGYLDRLDRSTAYIRQFIQERTSDERIVAQISKPVSYSMKTLYGYCTNSPEGIKLELGYDFGEFDARYALSLMDPTIDSWQTLGFAYWLSCVNPYNIASGFDGTPTPPDIDYYYMADYFRVGGTGKTWETKERLLYMDACSWYNLTNGMDWDGENPERSPIRRYGASAGTPEEEGNDMSLFMAISLTRYLTEQFGADRMIAYCFDTCTFEEAFGVSFAEARAAWEQSLMDRFGDGSEEAPPEVSFDEETKTLRVTGTGGYDRLDLTPYLSDARYLEVEDDEFRFSADAAILKELLEQEPYQVGVPGYLDRLDRGTAYVRQFIRAKTSDEKVAAQLGKSVHYTLKTLSSAYCTNTAEGIELELGPDALEYDARYVLSLTKPGVDTWKSLGFAYWLGCVDPCNFVSVFDGTPTSPDSDYFYLADYFRVGGTGKTWEAKEKLLCMDACSWYILTRGRDWAGADAELRPIWKFPSSSRKEEDEGNDLSLFMAISLINYLAEQHGEDKVIVCCFDTCTFEEAFGMSFAEARAAWEQSLLERFGDGSEAPQTTEPSN